MLKNKPKESLIGTRNESSLHKSLKFHYSGENGATEAAAGLFVCDGRTSKGELIEVQTGSFGPLKKKAEAITKTRRLRIIHPVIIKKHIELYDENGLLIRESKSTRKGSEWDLFKVLIYAPELPLLKNLCIELAFVEITEKRINDGAGSWRRKGVSIAGRNLNSWRDSLILSKPDDYYHFIPFAEDESFTVSDLAEKTRIRPGLSRKTLYVLRKMGLVERVGRRGNAPVYARKGVRS